jgi:hypothetical protein
MTSFFYLAIFYREFDEVFLLGFYYLCTEHGVMTDYIKYKYSFHIACDYTIEMSDMCGIYISMGFTKERLKTGMHHMHSALARNLFTTIIMLGCYQYIISNHNNKSYESNYSKFNYILPM